MSANSRFNDFIRRTFGKDLPDVITPLVVQMPRWSWQATDGGFPSVGMFTATASGADTDISATTQLAFNSSDTGAQILNTGLEVGSFINMVDESGNVSSFYVSAVITSGIFAVSFSGGKSTGWVSSYSVLPILKQVPDSGFTAPQSSGNKEIEVLDYTAVDFSSLDVGNLGLSSLSAQVATLTQMMQALLTTFRSGKIPKA